MISSVVECEMTRRQCDTIAERHLIKSEIKDYDKQPVSSNFKTVEYSLIHVIASSAGKPQNARKKDFAGWAALASETWHRA